MQGLDCIEIKEVVTNDNNLGVSALTTDGEVYFIETKPYVGKDGEYNYTALKVQGLGNVKIINITGSIYSSYWGITTSGKVYYIDIKFMATDAVSEGSNINAKDRVTESTQIKPEWSKDKFKLNLSKLEDPNGDFIKREYKLEDTNVDKAIIVYPGDMLIVTVRGKVKHAGVNQVIGNQAYASFEELVINEDKITLNKLPEYGNPEDPYEAGK